ncbi:DUF3631 domain-containing protein [Paraburkholderia hayleyella]|uniref:DUF3631 domain-containing protein n=1 Tax=Paraburkholderia hayleyella TaxID=2152889 RepID=UPI0015807999|nr:DUF3631 domain-containing protein [Paraburkholderia hayleyella]
MSAVPLDVALTDPDYMEAAGRLFRAKKVEGFEPVALHLYRVPDGTILYARVRMHKPAANGGHEKFIRPFWHNGARWTHGEPKQGGGKLLYGLPDLVAHADAVVVIVEGEQKADALTKIGAGRLIGITSGGATSVGTADWSLLAGRHVLLWPDYDAPGAKYANEVTAKLDEQRCTVERLDVTALGLPDAGDVMDWLVSFEVAHKRVPNADEVLALPRTDDAPIASEDPETTVPKTENETDEQAIERLAALKPMQYDRVRGAEARRMGVKVSTLDRMILATRSSESRADDPFPEVEPWHEPVDGAALLDELVRVVQRFIVCNTATAHATALWITMTWLIDSVDVAPIAAITAPEKRCGKSQLLFLIGRLSSRPLAASNITPAALFRAIEAWKPTLLIDEADAFMRENEELRGLLNCGHTRDSAYVVRTVGDDHMPKQFFVWGAKAIAGIGHLADTLMDRSITLELRRKLAHEQVDKLRHAEPGLFERLRAKLARWADDNEETVRVARPVILDALHDRAADNWEPLLQIAGNAGGAWPERARQTALVLSGGSEQAQSTGTELLADIQEVFETRKATRLFSADLLDGLLLDEEKPWATWRGGKPMTLKQLSNRLGEYGIRSAQIRIGYESKKGFLRSQFDDAFNRYLSVTPTSTISSETSKQTRAGGCFAVSDSNGKTIAEEVHVINSDDEESL